MTYDVDSLLRITDTCLNLLESLTVLLSEILEYTEKHQIPLADKERFAYLLKEATKLIDELNAQPFLQHRKRTDDFLQRDESDEDLTESPTGKI